MKIRTIIINCVAIVVLLGSLPKTPNHTIYYLSPESLFFPLEKKLSSQEQTLKRLNQKLTRGEPINILFVCGLNKERSFLWHMLGAVIVREKGLSEQIKVSSAGVFAPVFDLEFYPEEQREIMRTNFLHPNTILKKCCLEQFPPEYHDIVESFSASLPSLEEVQNADVIVVAADAVTEVIAERTKENLPLSRLEDKIIYFSLLSEDLAKDYQQNMPDYSTWVNNFMKKNKLKDEDISEEMRERLALEYFEITNRVLREKFFAAILSPLEEAHSPQTINSIQTAI